MVRDNWLQPGRPQKNTPLCGFNTPAHLGVWKHRVFGGPNAAITAIPVNPGKAP